MNENNPFEQPRKNRAKMFWSLLTVIILALLVIIPLRMLYLNPCNVPIKYSIGDIDPKFKISKTEVKNVMQDVAERWNSSLGQIIYEYDDSSKLKINLVYDSRQLKLDQTKAKIAEFDHENLSIEEFRNKVEALSDAYENDLEDYNNRVSYWNSQGGAPQNIFNQLNNERDSLEKQRLKINEMAGLLNKQIAENNSNIADFNSQLENDENKIITTGEYFTDGSKINIYTYGDKDELRLVLMHELGHAMSSDHDSDPKSILYPILQDQDMNNPLPSNEDISMVDKSCGLGKDSPDFESILNRIHRGFMSTVASR